MELFEDFEFKPLTEGLGFHRNTSAPAATAHPAAPASPEVKAKANEKPNLMARETLKESSHSSAHLNSRSTNSQVNHLASPQSSQQNNNQMSHQANFKSNAHPKTQESSSFAAPLELKEPKPAFVPSLKSDYNFMDEESLGETKKFAQELTQPQPQSDRTKIYQPIGRKDYSPPTKVTPTKTPLTTFQATLQSSQGVSQGMSQELSQNFSVPVPGAPASLSALRQQKTEANANLQKASGQNQTQNLQAQKANQNGPKAAQKAGQKGATPSFAMNALTATAGVSTANLGRPTEKAAMPGEQKNLLTCFPAAVLDGVFAFGVSTILLVIVLLITKADLIALLANSKTDHFVQLQLGVLYLMVLQMYMLVSRSTLFGQSLGEWTYEIQLGDEQQRAKIFYPLQVVLRGFIFAITGFITLPLLSLIFSRDLAAMITTLELRKKPYEQQ